MPNYDPPSAAVTVMSACSGSIARKVEKASEARYLSVRRAIATMVKPDYAVESPSVSA